MKRKIISKISLVLCVIVLINCVSVMPCVSALAQEKPIETCQETTKINDDIVNKKLIFTKNIFTFFDSLFSKPNTKPDEKGDKVQIRFPFIIVPFHDTPNYLKDIKMWLWV